jgi:hypothetical protein
MKKALYSLAFALVLGLSATILSTSVHTGAKASVVNNNLEVQVLDVSGAELTDPNNRPLTYSGGKADLLGLPHRGLYRIKLLSPGASCGTAGRYPGALISVGGNASHADMQAPLVGGNAGAAAGWYLYTNLASDDGKTCDLYVRFWKD